MITKFKIFENKKTYEDVSDLGELFSQEFIEKYFKDSYEVDINDIVEFTDFWRYVDKDDIAESIIENLITDTQIYDDDFFEKEDYANYIKNNMLDIAKEDINDYREEYEEYDLNDEDMVDVILKNDILEHDLLDIITKYDKEKDFKTDFFENKYLDKDAEEILNDIHGEQKVKDDLYDLLFHYIDENEVLDDYVENFPFDYKWDYFTDDIPYSSYLQKELLKIDPSTVICLYNVMNDDTTNCDIGCTYNFQKLYIDEKVKNSNKDKNKDYIIEQSLLELNDKFELNSDIKKEYSKYMYVIDLPKYNL